MARRTTPLADRFWAKVDTSGDCWLWTGAKDGHGYGYIGNPGGTRLAHRVSWMLAGRSFDPALVLDHLCRTPSCVNPDHLEQVTQGVNVRRGEAGKALAARKAAMTECTKGHPYVPENIYTAPDGKRTCRTCARKGDRERKRAKREAARAA